MAKKLPSKSKQPTMQDVARLAGVSQPTVSRVLNEDETAVTISGETKERVLAAVKALGYHPNVVARRLRTQRTQTVALLIADLANSFYHPIVHAIRDVARQHNYEILISSSDHRYENEIHFCEIVLGRGVDGAIMVPQHLTTEEIDHYVSQTNIPFVVLGEQIDHPHIDVVSVDDEQATYEVTNWLISQCGHTHIGYIGVPDVLPPGPRRLRGFIRAMTDAGLTDNIFVTKEGDFTLASGYRIAHKLLEAGQVPSALMVINDLMAIGIMLTLQEAGYSIPEDVAVVGFDDIPEATIVRPTLTTIAQNSTDIGHKLATALFEHIDNPNITERRVFHSPYTFIPRQSTRCAE
jgi:DNA-binding LacI/PurR family transcriptional regulator